MTMGTKLIFSVCLFLILQQYGFAQYKVTTILEPPYTMVKLEDGEWKLEGYIPDMMDELAERLGFTYELELIGDGRYGAMKNGEWNGMVRAVMDGKADIAAAAMYIRPERQEVVDFTKPYMAVGITGIKQKRRSGQNNPVKTLEDLVERGSVGVLSGGYTMNFFRDSHDPTIHELWKKMEENPSLFCDRTSRCIDKAKNITDYVFFTASTQVAYMTQRDCELEKFGDALEGSIQGYGLAVRKGDQLADILNGGILSMMEDGTFREIFLKWWRVKGHCNTPI